MKRTVGFNIPAIPRKINSPRKPLVRKSALRLGRVNDNLADNLAQGGNVGRIAAHRIVKMYSLNNIRNLINNSFLNENIESILVHGWIEKVINSGNISEISKILGLELNLNVTTKRKLMMAMRAHMNSVINNLIKSGTANQIQNFLNKINFKTDVATRNKLLSVWSLRRQNTPTLHKMIEHLTSAPYQTKMSRDTLASLRAELNRRRLH